MYNHNQITESDFSNHLRQQMVGNFITALLGNGSHYMHSPSRTIFLEAICIGAIEIEKWPYKSPFISSAARKQQ